MPRACGVLVGFGAGFWWIGVLVDWGFGGLGVWWIGVLVDWGFGDWGFGGLGFWFFTFFLGWDDALMKNAFVVVSSFPSFVVPFLF